MIHIDVINQSTMLDDEAVEVVVRALQKQVRRHWRPAWGTDATLHFVPSKEHPNLRHWWIVVLDNSDVAGALGYHDVTDAGYPLGKVFVASDLQYGCSWSVTLSHELLEMLGDPDINLCAFSDYNPDRQRLYAVEVCDPVEADALGYTIDGVLVSDFVLPAWFSKHLPGPWDHMKHCRYPYQVLHGGYINYFDISNSSGWHQLTEDSEGHRQSEYHTRPKVGSRRERRRTPRQEWRHSSVLGGREAAWEELHGSS